jgi:small subunit ribosomal protein S20
MKDIRVSAARRERNKMVKSKLKTSVRQARAALVEGDAVAAEAALKSTTSELDKAVGSGIVHPNNAARRKSRLTKKLNALNSPKTT